MPSKGMTLQTFPVPSVRIRKPRFESSLEKIPQERLLGRGGFGQTLEIEDPTRPEQTIVLKRFYADRRTLRGRGVMRHIHEELRKIDPTQTYFGGLFLQQGDLHMTMRNHGVSLEALSRSGKLDKGDVVRGLYRNFPNLIHGLQKLHSEKWIHGDVKAANILVSDSFHLRLIDYDLTGEESAYRYAASKDLIFPRSSMKRFYYIWPWERWYDNRERCFMWDESNFRKGMRGYHDVGLFKTRKDADIAALLIEKLNRVRWVRPTPPKGAPPAWVARMIKAHATGAGYIDYDDLFDYLESAPIDVALFEGILPSFLFDIIDYYTVSRGHVSKENVLEIDTFGLGLVVQESFLANDRERFLSPYEQRSTKRMVEVMLHPDPTKRSLLWIHPSKETAS